MVALDNEQEVAYETAVLGRLRRGYRVFQLRCELGTRIEQCYLLVKISFGSEPNQWPTPRQVQLRSLSQRAEMSGLVDETVALRREKNQMQERHEEELAIRQKEVDELKRKVAALESLRG